ncbi:histidinol-phosphate transaminase [Agrilutibacter solisilvae]|uniref:Histidinol-phosphate aminotransferase n=1 Tax=Agrilutibacter solisilvae TaxID=2763317 RepID=A0A974XYK5_9GAMM|nr:histidinol-phosphate transaminase [Lysobacter solisilvae]QSX78013.1 histidinol-phosphate transaminase [Lysobacter solisilvae]
MSILSLLREDLRDFGGYRSARSDECEGSIWLNANESPQPGTAEGTQGLRRYPDPQPPGLRSALARLYGCRDDQLLAGRGSDEAIDLLLRALCPPGAGCAVITTPTFGMYAVCARLHGTRLVDVPLVDGPGGHACDFDTVAAVAQREQARLVFLCSPGNPGGNLLPLPAIAALAQRLRGTGVVVVDEAYIEFAQSDSAVALLDAHHNIAVLRTLSKAHALAGARIGCVVADAMLIAALRRCQAPYPLPQPCVEMALAALESSARAATRERVERAVEERDRLQAAFTALTGIRRVYRSRANFLLVRFEQAQDAYERLLAAGIVVRDMRSVPGLGDALRISIGTPDQNDAVLAALGASAGLARVAPPQADPRDRVLA